MKERGKKEGKERGRVGREETRDGVQKGKERRCGAKEMTRSAGVRARQARKKENRRTADSDRMDVGKGSKELIHVKLKRRDRFSSACALFRMNLDPTEQEEEGKRVNEAYLDLDHRHRLLELSVMSRRSVDSLRDVLEDQIEVDLVLLLQTEQKRCTGGRCTRDISLAAHTT
jgi:hypothetical protein